LNALEGAACALGGIAALLLLLAGGTAVPRSLRSARERTAQGTITGLHRTSRGPCPIVTFSPDSVQQITFETQEHHPPRGIGDTLAVFYDSRDPRRATVVGRRVAYRTAAIQAAVGLALLPAAAALAFWLAPLQSAHDDVVEEFLAAARRGDEAALRARTAPGAVFDEAYMQRYVRSSTGFEHARTRIGFDDRSCVAGSLKPHGVQIVMSLVQIRGVWKVRGVSRTPDVCNAPPN
jgi:hypothetical protein